MTALSYMHLYGSATSENAKDFLLTLLKALPFKVVSIQVDGGSEFRDAFEDACDQLKIELFVLPPKSPKLNGAVERCNGTSRCEFYPMYQ